MSLFLSTGWLRSVTWFVNGEGTLEAQPYKSYSHFPGSLSGVSRESQPSLSVLENVCQIADIIGRH